MVFVTQETDNNDKPYDRYRSCYQCNGSGYYPRWVSLEEFHKLLQEAQCSHEHTSTRGGMHFSAGDVWDDLEEVCDDCGAILDN